MEYIVRPGLVLEDIFDKHLLIADEKAREFCAYLSELDPSAAEIMKGFMEKKSVEDMVFEFAAKYGEEPKLIKEKLESFIQKMAELNYLIPKAEESCKGGA